MLLQRLWNLSWLLNRGRDGEGERGVGMHGGLICLLVTRLAAVLVWC